MQTVHILLKFTLSKHIKMTTGQKTFLLKCIVLLVIAAGVNACNDFDVEKKIPDAQWSYNDTIDFKVPITDTTRLYNLYIKFAHSDTFPNQNIYLKLYTRFPDGKRVSRIRSFDLYDAEGKPQGKCSGSTCEAKILLQDKLYFNQIGDYLITLEQYSRSNPLIGLSTVGLSLEKTEAKR